MAPTKRIDETGDDDGVESADLRVPDCANPFRVSHGAAHSRGACESLTGLSGCRKNIEQGAAFSDMGYEYNRAMSGNPLILRQKYTAASSSTLLPGASCFVAFRPVWGCYGSKMGADDSVRESWKQSRPDSLNGRRHSRLSPCLWASVPAPERARVTISRPWDRLPKANQTPWRSRPCLTQRTCAGIETDAIL